MSVTIPKELENISTEVLRAALKSKEAAEIAELQKEIADYEEILHTKKATLAVLTGEPVAPRKGKRGRKKGFKLAKAPKAGKGGTRDTGLKEVVLKFLARKGAEGAHVDEIAKHAGKPKVNINAFLATTGKKNGIVGKGKRSGIYFLK